MTDDSANGNGRFRLVILIGAAVIAIGSIGYAITRDRTAPETPPEQAAAQPTEPAPDPAEAISALQKHVHDNPEDVDAWRQLGWLLYATGNSGQAVAAYARATELSPGDASLWSAMGEAIVMTDRKDPMPAPAAKAFAKALAINPRDPRARYYEGIRKDISGDHSGAINDWFALLADTKPGAPYERDLVRTIMRVADANHIDIAARLAKVRPGMGKPPVAVAAIPGPTREEMTAGNALPKDQKDAMVSGMVASLESKLQENSGNIDGWIMLMRSRMTLGQPDKAEAALKAAIAANPSRQTFLREQARMLGVPGA